MEVCVLASSSAGNAFAIRAGRRIILVDAGLSARAIEERLVRVGWQACDIAAILLSHEHHDHVQGAGVLSRRYGIPIYGTAGTIGALGKYWRGSEDLRAIRCGVPFSVGEFAVEPFTIPHDVADPAQFVIRHEGTAIGIATDLGKVTALVATKLASVDLAIVEANHDRDLLRWGDYPWAVKQRIASPHGHLDNEKAAELVVQLAVAGVGHIVLAHLSPRHNDVERVRKVVEDTLALAGIRVRLTVVGPNDGTGVIECRSKEERG